MGVIDSIRARHSVRSYTGKPIEGEVLAHLEEAVRACATQSGLDVQLVRDNPEVFGLVGGMGFVRGARDCIAFVADGSRDDEEIGYWGERLVLTAQELGLNTCWLAFCARKKCRAHVTDGKRVRIVIAVGYGRTQGSPHKSKPLEQLCSTEYGKMPAWFVEAAQAALLAPTAMNAQRFHLTLLVDGRTVRLETPRAGWCSVDRGIVRRTFEEAANATGADWRWER